MEDQLDSSNEVRRSGFTRRQVATAGAWSIPAIAIAVAAPAYAASAPVIVPGQPGTYPDATFSGTTQTVGDPSLSATGNTAYARTTFTAVSDNEDGYASYKAGWTYTVTSASPFSNVTFDASTLSDQGSTIVGGVYTRTFTLITAAVATYVRVKPTVVGQEIRFVLLNTTSNSTVGDATARAKA